jgi:hypothetical protein
MKGAVKKAPLHWRAWSGCSWISLEIASFRPMESPTLTPELEKTADENFEYSLLNLKS